MLTLEGTIAAAHELATTGERPANIKFACWTAMLSAQKGLEENGAQARFLADFVEHGLPTDGPIALWHRMRATKGCAFITRKQCESLYYVEGLWSAGVLDRFTVRPTLGDVSAWREWRNELLRVLKGHCFSRKTVSMVALILWPLESMLVPVDCHVASRLGKSRKQYECLSANKSLYLECEDAVYGEWAASESWVPFMVWHWFKWEEWRRAHGLFGSKAGDGERPESHAKLSCRWY